jgi:hypothetical protein
MILTSAARSGGEVRITEAERPRRIHPGQRGCQAGIVARSAGWSGHGAEPAVCGCSRDLREPVRLCGPAGAKWFICSVGEMFPGDDQAIRLVCVYGAALRFSLINGERQRGGP